MSVLSPRNSPARRWTLKITLALLAGAVVTWAVAWGCVKAEWSGPVQKIAVAPWPRAVPAEWNAPTETTLWTNPFATTTTWRSGQSVGIVENEIGFPLRAMRYSIWWDSPRSMLEFENVVALPLLENMPVGVLPLGFTLNTLLAAAVILTLTEGAGAWRRRARRRKGKCPWCGYDRAGVAVDAACPECGARDKA